MTTVELIKGAVPYGRENAIRRCDLAHKLGLPDRSMRKAIEDARNEGLLIVNTGSGEGYYQTDDPDELLAQYKLDTARAMAVLKRRKAVRRRLAELGITP